ncbi:MAG: LPXTG cell wall anchor domain-containing protein [Oscillospiraceae bacterium]|nr:LPXTG cell wall anchor domain-containing protein [Oscillospiraceae bacterium]
MSISVSAFAQTVGTANAEKGSITISNAAKGETYKIFKLFNASVTANEDGAIAYTGTIPTSLADYFEADSAGNISAKEAAFKTGSTTELSDEAIAALETWAEGQTATAEAVSDGSELVFAGIDFGYYVITTTQGENAISVDSTNRNVTVVDKNTTEPNLVSKEVDDDNVYIGQTVEYTVVFNTSNFNGAGADAKRIVSYTITDTLPEFLTDVTVTSIKVDNDANVETTEDQTAITTVQFNEDGEITIPWVNEAKTDSLYKNGAAIIITYTAVVTDKAAIDGAGNTNTVTLKWTDEDNEETEDEDEVSETIFTYALAIKKVDDKGVNLAGAVFEFPFYVKKTADTDGAYIYAFATLPETFAEGDSAENYTNSITTPDSGEITIKGLESGTAVSITETEAPDGFNKLTAPVSVTPVKTSETTTSKTWKIKDGQVVEDSVETDISTTYTNENLAATPIVVINKTGVELPSTGGIGTTIFYVVGSIMVVAAGVLLITKKRMSREG